MADAGDRICSRSRQPDRGAHRLQRGAGAALRHQRRGHGAGHPHRRGALPGDRLRPRRARHLRPQRRRLPVAGWRAFARGAVGELTAAGCDAGRGAAGDHRLGAARLGPVVVGRARGGAVPGAAGRRRRWRRPSAWSWRGSARAWRTSGWGPAPGLLDQIASLFGQPDSAMRIDFRSLEVTPVALELDGYRLVTLDSGERHAHAGDDDAAAAGYNQRRAECGRAAEMLGVRACARRPLSRSMSCPSRCARAPGTSSPRTRGCRTPSRRCQKGDLERVGELLNASHASLRDCFAISTPTRGTDGAGRCVDAGAIGARIVGGGFGGHRPGTDAARHRAAARRDGG